MSKDTHADGADNSAAPKDEPKANVTLIPDALAKLGDVEASTSGEAHESVDPNDDASDAAEDEEAAAQRLALAQAELAKMKSALGSAIGSSPLPKRSAAPNPDDVDTEIDESPAPLRPSRPDPLSAAEQALAMAAKARGVPLQLPSRVPSDRSDPFAAATRALQAARIARGEVPATPAASSTASPSRRHRDPFKAAEAALERAAAARAEIGVSPEQDKREAAARAELARLRAIKPTTSDASDSDSDAPTRKKRDL